MVNEEGGALLMGITVLVSLQVSTYISKRFPNIKKGMMVSRGWKEDIKFAALATGCAYGLAKGYDYVKKEK